MAEGPLADPEVAKVIAARTVPVRLLLGHKIDCRRTSYFPAAKKVADRFGVRSDPAFLLIRSDGAVLWKRIGLLGKAELLAALSGGR